MKNVIYIFLFVFLMVAAGGCREQKTQGDVESLDSLIEDTTADTTVYGRCGSGTMMNMLELVKNDGDTVCYLLASDEDVVKGGLFAGDRMAVTGYMDEDGDFVANSVLNMTTLLGKWTSIDKNFEIQDGGVVSSMVKAENKTWTAWKIENGKLLLNTDTFTIESLGADTLSLENSDGIFVYQRQR